MWVATISNRTCGLLQFLSRPFVVGERVQLTGVGGFKVSGVVEEVEPIRTLLRTDDGVPIRVPNKVGACFCCRWHVSFHVEDTHGA